MKILSSAILVGGLMLGAGAYAQTPGETPAQGRQESETPKVSVTGCLTKGSGAGEYVVTDSTSGEKLPFMGPAQLDKYVNQTVKLTGTMATQGANKNFKPQAVNQVSPSCGKPE